MCWEMYNLKMHTHKNYGTKKKHFDINTNEEELNLPNWYGYWHITRKKMTMNKHTLLEG
jgi:hypothetical protein